MKTAVLSEGCADQPTLTLVKQALREALAWGMVYGPVIANDQWDEMREKMVEQFMSQITIQSIMGKQNESRN